MESDSPKGMTAEFNLQLGAESQDSSRSISP